jgi:hypothetical protein
MDDMDTNTVVTIVALLSTNIFIAYQIILVRRQLFIQTQSTLTEKWNALSLLEMSDPELHRMLMRSAALDATRDLDATEMRERAFAHMVFDVCAENYKVCAASGDYVGNDEYLRGILTNKKLREYWTKYRVRDAFKDEPFGEYVDATCRELDNPGSALRVKSSNPARPPRTVRMVLKRRRQAINPSTPTST